MKNTKITVDYNEIVGKIKPIHCGNGGPACGGRLLPFDFTEEFKYMGIPYTRLHDIEYPYGSNQFVDMHCIFPDFDADENEPASYNFKPTDDYLKAIINAGGKVFYRLGESIDHFPKQLYVHPPKSCEKWARICEHIIMHYNEGWADGFEFGIEYWEIWNEPDNSKMWTGTHEQFFELYKVTANHLKQRFGDSIKIGGCAFSGFYMLNRKDAGEWFKTLVPYIHEFLKYITSDENKAPLDFFSWHCYADTPEEVALHAGYARDILNTYNIKNCESILNEFNMYYCFSKYAPLEKGVFTDVASSLIQAQKSDIDMMMYYMFAPNSVYNCAYTLNGIRRNQIVHFAGIEAFACFNKLYVLGNEVRTSGDIVGAVDVLAAKNESEGAIMVVSRDFEGELDIDISGDYVLCSAKRIDDRSEDRTPNVSEIFNIAINNGRIKIMIEKEEILLLSLRG
jgi:hypothetical protein